VRGRLHTVNKAFRGLPAKKGHHLGDGNSHDCQVAKYQLTAHKAVLFVSSDEKESALLQSVRANRGDAETVKPVVCGLSSDCSE
jgi:hypothetical protein